MGSARLCIAACILAAPLAAQLAQEAEPGETAASPPKRPYFSTFFKDQWRLWSSPFRSGSLDTHTVKKYGFPAGIISTVLLATDRQTAGLLPNTADQTRWSGRVSQMGAAYTLAGTAALLHVYGRATGDRHIREAGWLGLEALAHTQLIVLAMKTISRRERPLRDDARGGFWRGGTSFPSGHAASSFALASVLAYEYRHHIAVPITAYTIATAVSASRMSARRHWFSDIFVGGSLGFLIGRYVYKTNHDPNLPGSPVRRTRRVMPNFGVGRHGLALSWGW